MKAIRSLLNESFARAASRFMCYACRLVLLFAAFCLVLACMGRVSFTLFTSQNTYENAIYAEEDHAPASRRLTVNTGDDFYVHADADDRIDPAIQAGLVLIYAAQLLPLMAAYWFLSCVFRNVGKGSVFTDQNARYLLYYGLLRFFAALCVPFLKLFIANLATLAARGGTLTLSTGSDMINDMVSSVAFLVAAYIIHYGIHLQDEVDHTL